MTRWVLERKKSPGFYWMTSVDAYVQTGVKYATVFTEGEKNKMPKPKGAKWIKLPERYTVEPGRIIAIEGKYLFRVEPEEGMRPTQVDRLAHQLCKMFNEGKVEC